MRRWCLLSLVVLATVVAPARVVGAQETVSDERAAADTAVALSRLEAAGEFDALYAEMHPDAQAVVPRAAVVGWYANEFAPLGPGVVTVSGVRFVEWTWAVTGETYFPTAEVAYAQPFDDGAVVEDVVRLVQDEVGEWRWFFGRDRAFVEAQIARYGSDPAPDLSDLQQGSAGPGAAAGSEGGAPRQQELSYDAYVDWVVSFSDAFNEGMLEVEVAGWNKSRPSPGDRAEMVRRWEDLGDRLVGMTLAVTPPWYADTFTDPDAFPAFAHAVADSTVAFEGMVASGNTSQIPATDPVVTAFVGALADPWRAYVAALAELSEAPTDSSLLVRMMMAATSPRTVGSLIAEDSVTSCDRIGWTLVSDEQGGVSPADQRNFDHFGACSGDVAYSAACGRTDRSPDLISAPPEGYLWLTCAVVVDNGTDERIEVAPSAYTLVTADDERIGVDYGLMGLIGPAEALATGQAPPGRAVSGVIGFTVPLYLSTPLRLEILGPPDSDDPAGRLLVIIVNRYVS